MPDGAWYLRPGEEIERKRLHERFGGRRQGGIGPSRRTPNVLVFTDPERGRPHGYFDEWRADGCFHYTGEGKKGDQRMVRGNAAILKHEEEGRALRVFEGAGGKVRYVDEFVLDDETPWYETDAPETGGGPIRKVIVFRLRPKTVSPPRLEPEQIEVPAGSVRKVPIEAHETEKAQVDPAREPYEAERREAKLVQSFKEYLEARGHIVSRLKVLPSGERKPIFSDLLDETAELIVEAKGSVTRESVRMAIGQLADYSRFAGEAKRAILLPERPREDLETLIQSQAILLFWPDDTGFASSPAGQL